MDLRSDSGVVVVGGASGIGAAAVSLAAKRGARVTICDVNESSGSEIAESLTGARFLYCDAGDRTSVQQALAKAAEGVSSLSVVTTVGGAHVAPYTEVDPDAWTREIHFNLTTAYLVCATALDLMLARGLSGSIVTMSSTYAEIPGPDRIGYCAAKAGVVAVTRSFATLGAPHGIRVNCVAPGATNTARFRAMSDDPDGVDAVQRGTPLGRLSEPEDVAEAIWYLVSAAPTVTGQVLHVNSGIYLH